MFPTMILELVTSPLKKKDYDALNSAAGHGTANVAHLPFAMSSVSFFHNIPNVPDGGINLDACLLARIFAGDIQEWDSAEILEKNEDLRGTLKGKIFVARRVQGSSSTKSITQFMNAKCRKYWPDNLVQSKLVGENAWSINTNGCEGSAGMTSCIRDNANSIGYIDSGHGWSEELKEVSVMNEDGNFLTSRYSHSKDGIANAANSGITPNTTIADWSDVDFLNKGGEFTWPIVVMSYIYVRTDLHRFIREENERGLLKLFLEAIYNDEYFGACEKLGFSKPPEKVVTMATKAIGDNTINFDFAEDENMWSFEFDTKAKIGQGKFVISSKRRSLAGMDIQDIAGREKKVRGDVEFLSEAFHELFVTEEGQLRNVFEELNDQKKRNQAALVLGAISFTLWMCTAVAWVMLKCLRRK